MSTLTQPLSPASPTAIPACDTEDPRGLSDLAALQDLQRLLDRLQLDVASGSTAAFGLVMPVYDRETLHQLKALLQKAAPLLPDPTLGDTLFLYLDDISAEETSEDFALPLWPDRALLEDFKGGLSALRESLTTLHLPPKHAHLVALASADAFGKSYYSKTGKPGLCGITTLSQDTQVLYTSYYADLTHAIPRNSREESVTALKAQRGKLQHALAGSHSADLLTRTTAESQLALIDSRIAELNKAQKEARQALVRELVDVKQEITGLQKHSKDIIQRNRHDKDDLERPRKFIADGGLDAKVVQTSIETFLYATGLFGGVVPLFHDLARLPATSNWWWNPLWLRAVTERRAALLEEQAARTGCPETSLFPHLPLKNNALLLAMRLPDLLIGGLLIHHQYDKATITNQADGKRFLAEIDSKLRARSSSKVPLAVDASEFQKALVHDRPDQLQERLDRLKEDRRLLHDEVQDLQATAESNTAAFRELSERINEANTRNSAKISKAITLSTGVGFGIGTTVAQEKIYNKSPPHTSTTRRVERINHEARRLTPPCGDAIPAVAASLSPATTPAPTSSTVNFGLTLIREALATPKTTALLTLAQRTHLAALVAKAEVHVLRKHHAMADALLTQAWKTLGAHTLPQQNAQAGREIALWSLALAAGGTGLVMTGGELAFGTGAAKVMSKVAEATSKNLPRWPHPAPAF